MRIISRSRLRKFWEAPGNEESEGSLRAWYTVVKSKGISWRNWAELKTTYGNASLVGDCVVFNIAGNKFRLVTRVRYETRTVYVLKVMTHREYDEKRWQNDCGCHLAPPATHRRRSKRR